MKKQIDSSCFVLFAILFFSCNNQLENKKYNYTSEILGEWKLAIKQINYPELEFNNDSTAIFTSMGDTLYRFKYYMDKNNLVLKDLNGRITIDKVLKLNKDTLIFETLVDLKEVQKYKRK